MEEHVTRIGDAVRRRMPVLDGWRGFAVLVVVLHNASLVMKGTGEVPVTLARTFMAAGWVGVSLFFVLSGFLITGILLDTRESTGYFRNFYIRRTLRIFPLYYATLAATCLLAPRLLTAPEWTAQVYENQVWYWAYLSNWTDPFGGIIPGLSHFWSLAVEEQFYLVWPLLVFLAGPRWFPRIAWIVAVAPLFVRWILLEVGLPPAAAYAFSIARCDALALGALLAVAARRPEWLRSLWKVRGTIAKWSTFAVAAIFLATRGFEPYDPIVLVAGQSLVAVLCAYVLLVALAPETAWERRLAGWASLGWLRGLGKYSYAIYTLHFLLHTALSGWAGAWVNQGGPWSTVLRMVLYAFAILALTTLLSMASWHLLESPFLRLKERFAPRTHSPA
jgi:peptidoglycan/LPS O-acetylase OafA/YrhL